MGPAERPPRTSSRIDAKNATINRESGIVLLGLTIDLSRYWGWCRSRMKEKRRRNVTTEHPRALQQLMNTEERLSGIGVEPGFANWYYEGYGFSVKFTDDVG